MPARLDVCFPSAVPTPAVPPTNPPNPPLCAPFTPPPLLCPRTGLECWRRCDDASSCKLASAVQTLLDIGPDAALEKCREAHAALVIAHDCLEAARGIGPDAAKLQSTAARNAVSEATLLVDRALWLYRKAASAERLSRPVQEKHKGPYKPPGAP